MKLKIECVKKDLMDKLSKIGNNVVVNNFIVELINSGRVTNFFCNENSYFFKGEDNYISICLNDCGIVVNSFVDGIDQVFQYDKSEYSSKIILNITTNINWPNHIENRLVMLYAVYDVNEKLVSYEIVTDSSLMSHNDEMKEILKDKVYDHYKITSNVQVIEDKLVKFETIDYLYDYTKNSINYGICDNNIEFNTVSSFVEPRFENIEENDYNLIKNGAQKVKTMI